MRLLRSLCMALSMYMYSGIPVPQVKWEKENMAYAMCFFPVVGLIQGACVLLVLFLCDLLGFSAVLSGALLTLVPLAVTGGIHMDGFCDTVDALSSHAPREKKLAIMKDPNCGAFAVIGFASHLLISFALWHEAALTGASRYVLALVPVLSRALSAFAVVSFKSAKGDGLLATFSGAADVRTVRTVSCLWFAAAAAGMFLCSLTLGGAALLAAGVVFGYYGRMAYSRFGGTTGDLAGWFVTVCELACLGAAVLTEKIGGLL